uniref:insulin-like growth factor-binding protein 1 n=1 Tax=Centroberyx gerrardi TaxID=166262 RepID=UPI003AAE5B47
MSGLYEKLMLVAVVVSLAVLAGVRSSPVVGPEPIRCAPCTQEKLNECPAIPADCQQVLREPGCGCCMACALERGASCGVHTAHCAEGLRCTPRPGEARPLHALTRGQGVCTEDQGQEEADGVPDHSSLHYLLGLNSPSEPRDTAEAQESIKAKVNAIRNKLVEQEQGPCHTELHESLDKIASSQQKLGEKFTTFYLPNCNKNGFYKSKQCESSLVGPPARCWCVSPWNGKKIPGSNDLPGDSECHQELTH